MMKIVITMNRMSLYGPILKCLLKLSKCE